MAGGLAVLEHDAIGETCVSGVGITVCAEWDLTGDPAHPDDFQVDYDCTGCSSDPNIGRITSPHADDFTVRIGTGFGDEGAHDVKAIDLDPTNAANESNVLAGYIEGDLTEDLFLQADSSGNGGTITNLFIEGSASADINVPKVQTLQIAGGTSGTIQVGEVLSVGVLRIGDPFTPDCGTTRLSGPLTIGTLRASATLGIEGDMEANVTIEDDIEAGADVIVRGNVDDVTVSLAAIGTGGAKSSIVQFGFATDTCTFAGDLTMTSGVNADTTLDILATLGTGGSVDLTNDDVAGTFRITKGGPGTILNGGDVTATGVVTLSSVSGTSFTGSAAFDGILSGGVIRTLGGTDLGGTIDLAGNVAGDIDVDGDVTSSATIDIGGGLGRGRILVDGLMDGVVTIADETGVNSLIHLLGGLDDNGSITINAGEGDNNAGGDIVVGPDSIPLELDPITYDGCIEILDNGSGGYGDLDGDVTVVGCHATNDDISLTIEGDQNGDVTIVQTDCENQVDWSACP